MYTQKVRHFGGLHINKNYELPLNPRSLSPSFLTLQISNSSTNNNTG